MRKKLVDRYLFSQVKKDLKQKMVFLGGPRQSGKTTLAKMLAENDQKRYCNLDDDGDRELLLKGLLPVDEGLIILDEIHKYRFWRRLVKGWFDKKGDVLRILVTGSARLDHYRHGGDSLQGRYHFLRLHPFSVAELGLSSVNEVKDLLAFDIAQCFLHSRQFDVIIVEPALVHAGDIGFAVLVIHPSCLLGVWFHIIIVQKICL